MPAVVEGAQNAPKSQACKHLPPCEEPPADHGAEIWSRRGGRLYRRLALARGWRGGVFPLGRPATCSPHLPCLLPPLLLRSTSVLPPSFLRSANGGTTEVRARRSGEHGQHVRE